MNESIFNFDLILESIAIKKSYYCISNEGFYV